MTLDRQGKRHYQLIDADTHVNEPPDLWIDRVPSKFKDRAPRMQRFEAGDAWILEGVKDPINFGLNAAAGMPLADMRQWMFWEEVRPGGYDPKARLAEMDADQVDGLAAVKFDLSEFGRLANDQIDLDAAGEVHEIEQPLALHRLPRNIRVDIKVSGERSHQRLHLGLLNCHDQIQIARHAGSCVVRECE